MTGETGKAENQFIPRPVRFILPDIPLITKEFTFNETGLILKSEKSRPLSGSN
jgi:hypothetical protein